MSAHEPTAHPAYGRDELARIVARLLAGRGFGVDARDVRIERSAHASSCALYDVDVQRAGSGLPPLLLKDLSEHARTPEATGVRPAHLYDPLREIAVYTRLLAPAGLGVGYYGGAFDRHGGRALLLVERVEAMALDYVGQFDAWLRAARTIGAMHRWFPERSIDTRARRHLVLVDGADLGLWIERAAASTPRAGDAAHALDEIVAHRAELSAAFDELPRALAHGELFASNILVDDAHVYPVDWELASIAPAAIDIAALTSGGWSQQERLALVDAWREGLGLSGADDALADRGASERAVELARLFIALRLIGWSALWTPPADEQHDWLAEALEAFSRWKEMR